MDKTASKFLEFVFSITRPWHLFLVISVTSGALIFNAGGIVQKLEILEDVEFFKFWLSVVWIVFTGLIVLKIVVESASFVRLKTVSQFKKLKAVRLSVSTEGQIILLLLKQFQPDSVQLLKNHPVCRELRNLGLIENNAYAISLNEYDDYTITESGEIVTKHADSSKFQQLTERDQMEFYKSVTGLSFSKQTRPSWAN